MKIGVPTKSIVYKLSRDISFSSFPGAKKAQTIPSSITLTLTPNKILSHSLTYPTCCPLVRFSHIASKMLRATGHARMVIAYQRLDREIPCRGERLDNMVDYVTNSVFCSYIVCFNGCGDTTDDYNFAGRRFYPVSCGLIREFSMKKYVESCLPPLIGL